MNRRRLLAVSAALAVGGVAGCVGDGPGDNGGSMTPAGPLPDVDDETLAATIRNANGFTFDLFGRLASAADEDGDPNLFASPLSVSTALAMTYAGARGETREQMRAALRYDLGDVGNDNGENDDGNGAPNEALHGAIAELLSRLNERGEAIDPEDLPSAYDEEDDPVPFELSIVNAVWGQEGYPFRDEYLELLETYYGAGLREVDYVSDAESAREDINEWVAGRTEDRIDELLPGGALDELTRLVLTNAIYFQANWAEPFEEQATETAQFTTLDGESVDVPMMRHSEISVPYGEAELSGGDVAGVELPYVGDEVSMLVVLPEDGAFESVADNFDGDDLAAVIEELEQREGRVELPRFEFESGFQLRPALEELGMVEAFDRNEADLTGMYDPDDPAAGGENLFVDDVYHDSYVAVDEEGTEAAAATAVVVSADSAPADPFEFVADRPFLFLIRDRPTDALLFFGRVGDPTAE
ncbi:serine protease inhibitor (serpin family) [Halalkaliarchaeum desulfuricum]|uniref:Serine protease inhibitor (Serpin family) n=1 Tax=Halalkaliarchaeum desulfuricum TaxID=2055893 RepID=A0A343TFK6_9EURY|nr:serpin family protein [Halalkaliarchaeum desulfuricum]AUX07878.1 serine protease inhibitor (serpin family) [Halalkaliarchaeum desulfuricum]